MPSSTRLVPLTRATATSSGYPLRLGPIAFLAPLDTLGESLGDGLEAVGAAVVAAERRPRAAKLKLAVRGDDHTEPDTRAAGMRIRRQARQLLENTRWLQQGLYFAFRADAELEAWLLVGGGDLTETDPGISFGDFELELSDVYVRGRPGTHRPARRLELADRRGGTVPRDTRGLIYSTDYADQAIPAQPLLLPGDVVSVSGYGGASPAGTGGLQVGGRTLSRAVAAAAGEVVSYLPDLAAVPAVAAPLELDAPGSVRAWDLRGAAPPAVTTSLADREPTLYGWERVLGPMLDVFPRLALDNGLCRLVWLGAGSTQGLAIEGWDAGTQRYVRQARALHATGTREARVVELTPERAVLEWIADGGRAMRAVLQRGWPGPRLESFAPPGQTAELGFAPGPTSTGNPSATSDAQTPAWVRRLAGINPNTGAILAAQSHAAVVWAANVATALNAPAGRYTAARALAVQVSAGTLATAAELAALSVVDAQPAPVLLAR